jgi:hypothetical protein
MSNNANYGGKIADKTAYIKQFNYGNQATLWTGFSYFDGVNVIPTITPTANIDNVYIPGNLYVNGSIINPSDVYLKQNIVEINRDAANKIMNLKANQFTFKNDSTSHVHYGFIAQDFEKEFPELVSIKPDKKLANIKAINYLEIIPLLVSKIQLMQKEIDDLKSEIKGTN